MLFHELAEPGSGAYFEQFRCTYRGNLDIDALRRAWQTVVSHYPILRSLVIWERQDKPLQVVRHEVELDCHEQDFRELEAEAQSAAIESFLREDVARGFDLKRAPLMRIALLRTADDAYVFVWSFHHILLDGWSGAIVMDSVYRAYVAYCKGDEPALSSPPPYGEFIAWLDRQDKQRALDYWRSQLAGFRATTAIGEVTEPGSLATGTSYHRLGIRLEADTAQRLQELSRSRKITLNTIAQGAWAYLLSRYSGEDDVVFGSTVSGRLADITDIENMVGIFINTVPVRVRIDSTRSAAAWLDELQAQQVESREFEYCPLAEVQKVSDVPPRQALFDSILIFENYPAQDTQSLGLDFEICNVDTREQTNYPLTIGVEPGNGFLLSCTFDTDRFEADAISRLLAHYRRIFENIAEQIDLPINHQNILDKTEQRKLDDWNRTERDFGPVLCVQEMFANQVARTPDETAVIDKTRQLTFTEVEQRANLLAGRLRARGVERGDLVGLCVDRTADMVISMLAILKTGAAYVPLDPAYPPDRIQYILDDAAVRHLVSETGLPPEPIPPGCSLILLDDGEVPEERDAEDSIVAGPEPDDLAYVIYTSGSTGRPKGVMVPHRSVFNFLSSMAQKPGIEADEKLLAVTTLSFDIAVLELMLPLVTGATVEILDRNTAADGQALAERLDAGDISLMQATPSTWRLLLSAGWRNRGNVRILCGGEALTPDLAESLNACSREVWNLYGPTETTIWSTIHRLGSSRHVAIGKPIANTQAYVLSSDGQQQPIGVRGELFLGGDGVTCGYLNRESLTQERFVTDIVAIAGKRAYRTGDLVRILADGNLQYYGRFDNQVKLRGFRIELGEIESTLAGFSGIAQAVVNLVTVAESDSRLVAYYVIDTAADVTVPALRKYLRSQLPEFMLPQHYVELEDLPLTPNGKIDRLALPEPYNIGVRNEDKVAPQTEAEKLIAQVWREVLKVDAIGINDNFFELGGHSLLSIKVIAMVRQRSGIKLELRSVVMDTLGQIAARITAENEEQPAGEEMQQGSPTGSVSQKFKSVFGSAVRD